MEKTQEVKEEVKPITQLKRETEEMYLRVGNKIAEVQNELNNLVVERTRLEGEIRLLDKLTKQNG